MGALDEVVKRLADVTDELLALDDGDFANRFRLETERDLLRAQAAEFHQRKDEGRSTEQLRAELAARRKQLQKIRDGLVNRARQASSASGRGGGGERALGAGKGGTINNAINQAQGADSIEARIAEIKQELANR